MNKLPSAIRPHGEQFHSLPVRKVLLLLFSCAVVLCFTRTTFAQAPAPENDSQFWTDVQLQHWLNKKKTVDLIFTGTFRLLAGICQFNANLPSARGCIQSGIHIGHLPTKDPPGVSFRGNAAATSDPNSPKILLVNLGHNPNAGKIGDR